MSVAQAIYRGVDKSLARPTPRCILFDGENISFDASLVIYIYIYIFIFIYMYIPPIMIINRIYETQNLLSVTVACFLPGRAKDLSAPLVDAYVRMISEL
jgi:hypothetical protein